MRKFKYHAPDVTAPGRILTITEDEIIERYYDWWVNEMYRVGKQDLISKENCIEDWVVSNWAWEVEDDLDS